jgi:hypothetical protein
MSGHTTVGYDAYITVSDGKNTVGPKILTITVAGDKKLLSILSFIMILSFFLNFRYMCFNVLFILVFIICVVGFLNIITN